MISGSGLISQIKALIKRHLHTEIDYWIVRKFSGKRLNRNIIAVTWETYENYKKYREAEHQIGRFLNMKKVLKEVEELSISGDLVEFGTWQGQSLMLFDLGITNQINRRLVGIDSFEGLPESSTIWTKGSFSNTSVNSVRNRLQLNIKNFNGFDLIQGLFEDPNVARELYEKVKDISIAHLDADLGSSTTTALKILERYMEGRKSPMYILFDDWGIHPNEVPEAFNGWLEIAKPKYNIHAEIVGYTNLTRYYKLNFSN